MSNANFQVSFELKELKVGEIYSEFSMHLA